MRKFKDNGIMAKNFFVIAFLILFSNSITLAQNIEARVFEPENIDIKIINQHPANLSLNICLRDRRVSGNLFQEEIFSTVQHQFEKSFPKTKITFIEDLRKINTADTDQLLIIIDVIDYFTAKKRNKWIGKTTFNLKIFDYRHNNIQETKQQISHTATKPNRQSLQSAKQALAESYRKTLMETIHSIIHLID